MIRAITTNPPLEAEGSVGKHTLPGVTTGPPSKVRRDAGGVVPVWAAVRHEAEDAA